MNKRRTCFQKTYIEQKQAIALVSGLNPGGDDIYSHATLISGSAQEFPYLRMGKQRERELISG